MISSAFLADASLPLRFDGLLVLLLLIGVEDFEFGFALNFLRGVAGGEDCGWGSVSPPPPSNRELADLFDIANNSAMSAASSSMVAIYCSVLENCK